MIFAILSVVAVYFLRRTRENLLIKRELLITLITSAISIPIALAAHFSVADDQLLLSELNLLQVGTVLLVCWRTKDLQ
jgi:hypothetical protein